MRCDLLHRSHVLPQQGALRSADAALSGEAGREGFERALERYVTNWFVYVSAHYLQGLNRA